MVRFLEITPPNGQGGFCCAEARPACAVDLPTADPRAACQTERQSASGSRGPRSGRLGKKQDVDPVFFQFLHALAASLAGWGLASPDHEPPAAAWTAGSKVARPNELSCRKELMKNVGA